MNESRQMTALQSLTEVARDRQGLRSSKRLASVRVSPGAYLAAASLVTFSSALLLRSGRDLWSLVALAIAWILIPAIGATDRIVFDGHGLNRRGLMPSLFQLFFGSITLTINDFETVETTALRTLRRGGSVRYRYRSQISGRGMQFVFASGGRSYRKMVRVLFPLVHDEKMDSRSRDLRDYLVEPHQLNRRAILSQLAPPDVLAGAAAEFKLPTKRNREYSEAVSQQNSPSSLEKAHLLRRLGNELRVAGRLSEAAEAFRRALNLIPHEAWLIYDFARLLRSQASAKSDAKLLSKARAALRLAGIRAGEDARLLGLVGESIVECGDVGRAQRIFQKAIAADGANVRARLGLADVALREGKLAHVIHHHREASMVTSDKALALYAKREADYYARLNDDDEYLSAELRRINLLQHVTRIRRLAAGVTNAAILIALAAPYFDPTFAAIGWSIATSALIAWLTTLIAVRFLSARRKPNLEFRN